MITKLDVQQTINELTIQSTQLFKDKLKAQKAGESFTYEKREIKKISERLKFLKSVIMIIESLSEESLRDQRNCLIVKVRAIEEREPLKKATREEAERPYNTEEKKNKEVKARIEKEFALYGYKKFKAQLKALQYILKN